MALRTTGDRMSDRSVLNQEYAHEAFSYQDGRLYWKHRPTHHFIDEWRQRIFNSRQAGSEAGSIARGYQMVRFSWGKVGVHRIVFLMFHGYLPKEVDHINGDPLNNRIGNLRAATHSQNLQNSKTSAANKSGRKGVSFHGTNQTWSAYIRVGGRHVHLGSFKSLEAAALVRAEAEKKHYGEFSNGR